MFVISLHSKNIMIQGLMKESKVLIWRGLEERMLKMPSGGSFGWISGVKSHDSVALLSCIPSSVESEKEASRAACRQLTTDLGQHASFCKI